MKEKITEIKLFDLISKYRTELMGVATLWIFFLHKWVPIFKNKYLSSIELSIKEYGNCGVEIFLFLSGMGLVFAYEKAKNIKQFYFNRFKRIFIPYFARVLATYLLTFGFSIRFVKEIFFYTFFFESTWNTIAWYYCAIVLFYLLFPLYYKIFSKSKNKLLFTLIIIEIVLLTSQFGISFIREDFYNIINRIPIFVIGILFGYYGKYKNNYKFNYLILVSSILILFFWKNIYLGMYAYDYSGYIFLSISLMMIFSYLFYINKIDILNRFFNILGKNSFEIYMIQFCIDPSRFYNNFPTAIANILYFIVIVFVSILLRIFNEKVWQLIDKKQA